MLKVGDQAPNFSLPDQDNTVHSLHDYLGKWILLYFYPKDNTPGCTAEACGIRDSWDQFFKAGVTVLGVSADSIQSHTDFKKDHSLPFALLSDPDKHMIRAYEAYGEKSMFGKKYQGILRISYLIDPQGIIAHTYPKVSPKKHAQEILKDLSQLKNA